MNSLNEEFINKSKTGKIYSCLCMTCGVKNNHTNENGFCQNGHDNWLEYRDIYWENEHMLKAMIVFKLSQKELQNNFLDENILKLQVYDTRS